MYFKSRLLFILAVILPMSAACACPGHNIQAEEALEPATGYTMQTETPFPHDGTAETKLPPRDPDSQDTTAHDQSTTGRQDQTVNGWSGQLND